MQDLVTINRLDNVAVMTLDHGTENRISGPFCDAIRQQLTALAADAEVKAVVVTSRGKFFCNGLDLEWMKGQSKGDLYQFLLGISGLLKETALFPKPLVGAINGHAFGMGAIWASGFDFRIMRSDRGWVCFPEMDINIPFSPGMIAITQHAVGRRVFREMVWTARRYNGTDAAQLGWASKAVPEADLMPTALELAEFMGRKGTQAFSMTKAAWAREVVRVIDEQDADAYKVIPLKL